MKTYENSKKIGLPPGTLVHVGKRRIEDAKVNLFTYNQEMISERTIKYIDEFEQVDENQITWINVNGLHDVELIDKICKNFNIDLLVVEDILNTNQRFKIEEYNDYVYIVLKMIDYNKNVISAEQVSLILGKNFVITFTENEVSEFDTIRKRLRNNISQIRVMNEDYLMYCIFDTIIDNYFAVLEKFGETMESVEQELIENPTSQTMREIYNLKQEMLFLHKSVWSLREVSNTLRNDKIKFIRKDTEMFLRDVSDHIIQVIDTVELYRDILSEMIDTYLSSSSNKINEVMKILAVISTLFMPLTFMVGVYGMNFRYMPELTWKWGYFGTWGVIIVLSTIMITYFKKKKWL